MTSPITRRARKRARREGAVMLVVMLVVLMVTATGMFAVYSTTYELRSAGTYRQSMQTDYLAEGGIATAMALVDTLGAGSIDVAMQRVPTQAGRQFAVEEPAYAMATPHFRVYLSDFGTMQGVIAQPVEWNPMSASGPSLGAGQASLPDMIIDWDDAYRPGRAIAGMSVTGDSVVSYRVWTITARGRMHGQGGLLPLGMITDNYTPAQAAMGTLARGDHETAMNARAVVMSGPL
jgi:hypothetical protein